MFAGDTVNVKGGVTYIGSNDCNVISHETPVVCINTRAGTLGNQITYQAWAGTGTPVIDASAGGIGFHIQKAYVTIKGFEIKNAGTDYGSNPTGIYAITFNSLQGVIIEDNVIWNSTRGIWINPMFANSSVVKILNNTINAASLVGISIGAGAVTINNNIISNAVTGEELGGGSLTGNYNLLYGNTTNYSGISAGANDIVFDPLFSDFTNGDFHLQKSSPAINVGSTPSDVVTDILGVSRPQGSGYDIGAYEYYDILVTLTTTPTTPSSNTTPTIAGTASTIGAATISSVTYSVDSGSWVSTGVTGTSSFSIVVPALADGSHTVRVRATDSYGNVSDSTLYGSTTFTVDTVSPTSNSISINSGATYSTSTEVTLTLASTGATQMMISEDSGFSGASWESYSTSKSFTLSTGEGTKTVYAKFKDESGNTSSSVSDTITLDTVTPTLGSFISPRDYTKDDNKPTLVFKKATDSTSNISSYSVSLDSGKNKNYSTSGIPATGDTTKSSYIYKDDSNVKIEYFNENDSDTTNDEIKVFFKGLNSSELTEGKHSWKVTVTDLSGNENSSTQDFYLDRTSPGISEVAIANVSTVKKGQTYTISIFKRLPSFSGKVEDPSLGSEKTNSGGSKDTFDKVSSGVDTINLTIKKFDGKKYINHFSKDYSVTSNRFYITTPYPLIDGQYEITISVKDKAGNIGSHPVFYLKIGNNSFLSSATSFVSDLFNNKQVTPTPTNTPSLLNTGTPQPTTKLQSIFSWVASLFKSIFHK